MRDPQPAAVTTPTAEELCADGCLTIAGAVEFSGLGRSKLYELMDAGVLPYVLDCKRLIPRRALVSYLAERLVSDQASDRGYD